MTIPNAKHFDHTTPSSELAAAMAKPVSFKLLYWPIGGLAGTAREILAYGDAKWENLPSPTPNTWQEDKLSTPFHCLPVLYINTEDGKEITMSESVVVDHYLAKQFGLLGDNEYEEMMIKSFHCSSATFQSRFSATVSWNQPESKAKSFQQFKATSLPTWIQTHEKHLADNGNNGYYVGNKISLADIHTVCVIEHFSCQPEGDEIMELINKSEALAKVRENVLKEPKIAAWKASAKHQELTEASKAFFKDPLTFFKNEGK
ncbi:hypothetical protein BG011_009432 [Mortierella polycephala]|uniref:Glutathione S-transferase n=1 Tax=Mortierella polycephala TaxID=41804 RepID=A0A9P6PN54_9FUNG|nr:hypothetical protein BG011_009432 [Mortierella polycephala]